MSLSRDEMPRGKDRDHVPFFLLRKSQAVRSGSFFPCESYFYSGEQEGRDFRGGESLSPPLPLRLGPARFPFLAGDECACKAIFWGGSSAKTPLFPFL